MIQSGSTNSNLYLWIILESLGLFILPLILSPKKWKSESSKKRAKKQKKQNLNLKIHKKVKIESNYSPCIIKKCVHCRFENPSSAKICFNCGKKIEF